MPTYGLRSDAWYPLSDRLMRWCAVRRSRHGRCECLVEIPWKRMVQLPGDRHRALRLVTDVRGRPEEMERAVVCAEPREKQDVASTARVFLISPSCRAVLPGNRLALPMNEFAADGIVAVPGRGREPIAGLVERECQ